MQIQISDLNAGFRASVCFVGGRAGDNRASRRPENDGNDQRTIEMKKLGPASHV
jgi:hypothetical protein